MWSIPVSTNNSLKRKKNVWANECVNGAVSSRDPIQQTVQSALIF